MLEVVVPASQTKTNGHVLIPGNEDALWLIETPETHWVALQSNDHEEVGRLHREGWCQCAIIGPIAIFAKRLGVPRTTKIQ